MKTEEYLGDGVYVSYEGYYVKLMVKDDENPQVIYLEDNVLYALLSFCRRNHIINENA
jgi:hypothetical protein